MIAIASLVLVGSVIRCASGNAMPMPFGWGVAVVLSGSMEPALSKNDLVIVEKADAVSTGDIVVYQSGNDLVVHRVISSWDDEILTQGDANSAIDAPIAASNIKGIVRGRVPGIGLLANAAKSPLGTIALVALAALLVEQLLAQIQQQRKHSELASLRNEISRLRTSK